MAGGQKVRRCKVDAADRVILLQPGHAAGRSTPAGNRAPAKAVSSKRLGGCDSIASSSRSFSGRTSSALCGSVPWHDHSLRNSTRYGLPPRAFYDKILASRAHRHRPPQQRRACAESQIGAKVRVVNTRHVLPRTNSSAEAKLEDARRRQLGSTHIQADRYWSSRDQSAIRRSGAQAPRGLRPAPGPCAWPDRGRRAHAFARCDASAEESRS